jgi:hypothetical protein
VLKYSLFHLIGNFHVTPCNRAHFGPVFAAQSGKIIKFPVFFPVTREFVPETGSLETASSTSLRSRGEQGFSTGARMAKAAGCIRELRLGKPRDSFFEET